MKKDAFIILETTSLKEAAKMLDIVVPKVLFVVDNKNRLVGALSDGDIRRWLIKKGSLDDEVVLIMNKNPISLTIHQKGSANEEISRRGIKAIPILNNTGEVTEIIVSGPVQRTKVDSFKDKRVVIMAGGRGERLLPYTSVVPKPLLPINWKPILELIIERFMDYGCQEYYLTLNYKKNMIKAYFDDLEKPYNINYIEEEKFLGTGGSLYFLKDLVDDTFVISNCDVLVEADYEEILKYHTENKNLVTIVSAIQKHTIPYGVVNLNDEGSVESIEEKPSNNFFVNTGVYLMEPEALKYMKEEEFLHITDLIEVILKDGKKVGAFPIDGDDWMDMGQFEEMNDMKNKYGGLK
jgi:dTDP-glucose pyrophosphorylase